MAFGKRPATGVTQSQAPHRRQRVIPEEAWKGATGALLRELSVDANDEPNPLPNQQSVEERLAHGRVTLEAKLMRLNDDVSRKTGGGSLRPYFLVPDSCWNGAVGHFLMMRLDLFPYDEWNVAFLPVDERTAHAINTPLHPNGNIPAFEKAAEDFMAGEELNHRAAYAEAELTQNFAAFGEAREQIRNRVRAFAGFLLAELSKAWRARRAPSRAH